MLNILKGLTVSMMRSYYNDVKRTLRKRGSGSLLDVRLGLRGDVTKWGHYVSVVCIENSYKNVKEFRRRLGNNKKVRVIQSKIEHLREFRKEIRAFSCFFCMTLIDIDRLVSVAQIILSDRHACTFMCVVISREHIIKFFEGRDSRKYECTTYTIVLRDSNSIHIHIPDTIVLNQIESLVDVDSVITQFEHIGFEFKERGRLNQSMFMSSDEHMLSSMYKFLVMKRRGRQT